MITVIHGPMACGKTHNAEAFKKAFPHANFYDSWFGQEVDDDTLILTHLPPPYGDTLTRNILLHDVRIVPFAIAMEQIA